MNPLLLQFIPDFISEGIKLFDKKFVTDAEKEQAVLEFTEKSNLKIQDAWESEQKSVTARHDADMHSDSWLSKNIRPLALIYVLTMITLTMFITVPDNVIAMVNGLSTLIFMFYFGGRSLEKITNKVSNAFGRK